MLSASELLNVTWGGVNLTKPTIKIRTGKSTKLGTNGVAEEPRIAPLTSRACKSLESIKPESTEAMQPVFNIKAKSISSISPRIVKAAEIEDLQLRDLRREDVSRMLEKGYTVVQIAQFTGHRDVKMIETTYNQMSADKAVKVLD